MDGNRYWISTQPNVNRTAQERADQLLRDREPVWDEIIKRLRADKARGDFSAVHVAPGSSADIPDDATLGVRLVVLSPEHYHQKNTEDSPARQWVATALDRKGSSPRYAKNTLLFLAPDKTSLDNLERTTAQYLAWRAIVQDKAALNLDVFQSNQATTKLGQSEQAVVKGLAETYHWLLCPKQDDAHSPIVWKATKLSSASDSPILQASRKAVHEGDLLTKYGGATLRMEALDPFLWRDVSHIDLKRLWDYLTQYLYLPRLQNSEVLLAAVRAGVGSTTWEEGFAYAEGFDEGLNRYLGLAICTGVEPAISPHSLLVKPAIAKAQLEADLARDAAPKSSQDSLVDPVRTDATAALGSATEPTEQSTAQSTPKPSLRRFYASTTIDTLRMNRDVSAIANEVVQHLMALPGASVKISIEIEAHMPNGVTDDTLRTVSENCRTLKFDRHAFEEE